MAALAVFDEPIVLIAGGRDKHLPLERLADEAARKVKAVVFVGRSRQLLEERSGRGESGDQTGQPELTAPAIWPRR